MRRILGLLCLAATGAIVWQAAPVLAGGLFQGQTSSGAANVVLPPPDDAQQAAIVKQLPEGPGKDVLVKTCAGCHLLSVVTVQRKTEDQWTDTVIEMRSRGANASDDDLVALVEYLGKNFGPDSAPPHVNINKATAIEIAGALSITQDEANAVVDYRTKNGSFKDADGVKKVPGIEAAKIDAAKDRIDF